MQSSEGENASGRDMTVSTRHPDQLSPPPVLRDRIRALAILDEILDPRWDYRLYSFSWMKDGTSLGGMRNGEGDLWFVRFTPGGGAVLRGFDHNSVMSPFLRAGGSLWPGLFENMPPALRRWRNAVDVEPEETTFVLWYAPGDRWRSGKVKLPPGDDPDGSKWLLAYMTADPATYRRQGAIRFGRDLPLGAIREVYEGRLDAPTILALNPLANVDAILKSAKEARFPMTKKTESTKEATPPAVRRRNAGVAAFTVSVHDNKVELLVHGKPVAVRDVDGPEFYNALFTDVKGRIAGD
jgi:hypothetical protein